MALCHKVSLLVVQIFAHILRLNENKEYFQGFLNFFSPVKFEFLAIVAQAICS